MTRPGWEPADPDRYEQWIQAQLAKAPTSADVAGNPEKAKRLLRLLGLDTRTATARTPSGDAE